jgi:hypothetical protein
MPLSDAKDSTLQPLIKAAFIKVMLAGEKKGADPLKIIDDLSKDLANAIHLYTMQAIVNTTGAGIVSGLATVVPLTGIGPVVGVTPMVISSGKLA